MYLKQTNGAPVWIQSDQFLPASAKLQDFEEQLRQIMKMFFLLHLEDSIHFLGPGSKGRLRTFLEKVKLI